MHIRAEVFIIDHFRDFASNMEKVQGGASFFPCRMIEIRRDFDFFFLIILFSKLKIL